MFENRKFERYYPFLTPFIVTILYHFYATNVPNNLIIQKYSDWLNISFTLSGISLGFLGTMIGAVLSITNSKVMRFIYSQNADYLLMKYIREAAIINLLVLLFSIISLITSAGPSTPPSIWLLYPWLFTFSSSFLCSYRIIHLLFSLLEAVNNENRVVHTKKIHSPDLSSLRAPKKE